MAITINVGGSKKVSQNYDSQGVSLNVTAEVPNDAVGDPSKIANTALDLFDLVHELLDEQIAKLAQDSVSPKRDNKSQHSPGRKPSSAGGSTRSTRSGSGRTRGRGLTQAQSRAITNMARKLGEDADTYAQHEFGTTLDDLTVRQASGLIDVLKNEIESSQGAQA